MNKFLFFLFFLLINTSFVLAVSNLDSVDVDYAKSMKFDKFYKVRIETYDVNNQLIDIDSITLDYITPIYFNQTEFVRLDKGVYESEILIENQNITNTTLELQVKEDNKVVTENLEIELSSTSSGDDFKQTIKDIPDKISNVFKSLNQDLNIALYVLIGILGIALVILLSKAISNLNK